jgi:hypothetical protein
MSEPRAVATGSTRALAINLSVFGFQNSHFDPVATARGSDTHCVISPGFQCRLSFMCWM